MARFPHSTKSAQHVGKVLSDSKSSLGRLMQHANYLTRLETIICGHLKPDLAAQFQLAAVRKNRLILVTPTASWATRLRMHAPQLINSLREAGMTEIEYIDILVAPLVLNTTEKRTKRTLSAGAKQALDRMALIRKEDRD